MLLIMELNSKPLFCTIAAVEEEEEEETPWYQDIWNFIEKGECFEEVTEKDKKAIRKLLAQFIIYGGKLLKKAYNGTT